METSSGLSALNFGEPLSSGFHQAAGFRAVQTPKFSAEKKSVHFSSKTDLWATPIDFFNRLHSEFNFTLDPCCTKANAKCDRFFTRSQNGLKQDWGSERVFMNPPYGREIRFWMRKAYESAQHGATVVCLVPSRTDTSWWHDYAIHGQIRFLRGRLKFGGHKNSAPFPSAIVIFYPPNFTPEQSGGRAIPHSAREILNGQFETSAAGSASEGCDLESSG